MAMARCFIQLPPSLPEDQLQLLHQHQRQRHPREVGSAERISSARLARTRIVRALAQTSPLARRLARPPRIATQCTGTRPTPIATSSREVSRAKIWLGALSSDSERDACFRTSSVGDLVSLV